MRGAFCNAGANAARKVSRACDCHIRGPQTNTTEMSRRRRREEPTHSGAKQ